MRPLAGGLIVVGAACALAVPGVVAASTSHADWPRITGMLVMNKLDSDRPIDARPGQDPFGGMDPAYSCDEVHEKAGNCHEFLVDAPSGTGKVVGDRHVHNELLGGHGDDTIHAGPTGDVIWGDYKPSGQPRTQKDTLIGGPGDDVIYASHGTNTIEGGSGDDRIKAHFGRGTIDCGGGSDVLFISRRAQPRYRVRNCETVSHTTLGY